MSSTKKKLEEKNLKILRELLSYESNKYCFDCGQRGPTYVNMTIGSFVCTNCGGALRKYNHRVKSISMSNFNQSEMDFIKKRGNGLCKKIYYGLCDNNNPPSDYDSKNGMLDSHLRYKYEQKKWYVDPTPEMEQETLQSNQIIYDKVENPSKNQLKKAPQLNRININSSGVIIIDREPPTHKSIDPAKLSGGNTVKLPMPTATNKQPQQNLFDFDSNIAAAPTSTTSTVKSTIQEDLFSNFSTTSNAFPPVNSTAQYQPANSFNSSFSAQLPVVQSTISANNGFNSQQIKYSSAGVTPQTGGFKTDKYAALAELDDLFSQGAPTTSSSSGLGGTSTMYGAAHSSMASTYMHTTSTAGAGTNYPGVTSHWPDNTSSQAVTNPFASYHNPAPTFASPATTAAPSINPFSNNQFYFGQTTPTHPSTNATTTAPANQYNPFL